MGKLTSSSLQTLGQGKHGDGGGLYLQVKGESRTWLFRYTSKAGKERWHGFGRLKNTNLSEARTKATAFRHGLSEGCEPISTLVLVQEAPKAVPTLRDACEGFVKARSGSWRGVKYKADWEAFMERYVLGSHGHVRVAKVDTDMALDMVANPSRARSVLDRTVQRRLRSVLDYAKAKGWREGDNPARWSGHLEHLMPRKRHQVEHHPAIPYVNIMDFMEDLTHRQGIVARALQFLLLTATRAGEVRLAKWREIEFGAKVWTIPGERTKTGKDLRVPLSEEAMAILLTLARAMHGSDWGVYVFPGAERSDAMHPSSMNKVMKRMGWDAYTVHGMRSSFRDWVAEETDFPGELAEVSLGHVVAGMVERAYRRGDQLEKRRVLMQSWAGYCCDNSRVDLA